MRAGTSKTFDSIVSFRLSCPAPVIHFDASLCLLQSTPRSPSSCTERRFLEAFIDIWAGVLKVGCSNTRCNTTAEFPKPFLLYLSYESLRVPFRYGARKCQDSFFVYIVGPWGAFVSLLSIGKVSSAFPLVMRYEVPVLFPGENIINLTSNPLI